MDIKFYLNKYWIKFRELILYGLIGGLSSGLDFIVYTTLVYVNINYLMANMLSVNIGICTSFVLNRQFNFRVKDKVAQRFFKFYLIGFLGLALSTGMLYILVDTFGVNKIYSKISTIIVIALVQFILNKFITFKK